MNIILEHFVFLQPEKIDYECKTDYCPFFVVGGL